MTESASVELKVTLLELNKSVKLTFSQSRTFLVSAYVTLQDLIPHQLCCADIYENVGNLTREQKDKIHPCIKFTPLSNTSSLPVGLCFAWKFPIDPLDSFRTLYVQEMK